VAVSEQILIITERPSLVVECGSGASTPWLALAMRRCRSRV
jgi:hypothetical protein